MATSYQINHSRKKRAFVFPINSPELQDLSLFPSVWGTCPSLNQSLGGKINSADWLCQSHMLRVKVVGLVQGSHSQDSGTLFSQFHSPVSCHQEVCESWSPRVLVGSGSQKVDPKRYHWGYCAPIPTPIFVRLRRRD